jgi:hypothetical protein
MNLTKESSKAAGGVAAGGVVQRSGRTLILLGVLDRGRICIPLPEARNCSHEVLHVADGFARLRVAHIASSGSDEIVVPAWGQGRAKRERHHTTIELPAMRSIGADPGAAGTVILELERERAAGLCTGCISCGL